MWHPTKWQKSHTKAKKILEQIYDPEAKLLMSIKDHDQQARKKLKAPQENKKMTHIFIIHSRSYCEVTKKVMVVKSS